MEWIKKRIQLLQSLDDQVETELMDAYASLHEAQKSLGNRKEADALEEDLNVKTLMEKMLSAGTDQYSEEELIDFYYELGMRETNLGNKKKAHKWYEIVISKINQNKLDNDRRLFLSTVTLQQSSLA